MPSQEQAHSFRVVRWRARAGGADRWFTRARRDEGEW